MRKSTKASSRASKHHQLMTNQERRDHKTSSTGKRGKRIAKGSGTTARTSHRLKQYLQMRTMMKPIRRAGRPYQDERPRQTRRPVMNGSFASKAAKAL